MTITGLEHSYDAFPRIEAAFQTALDESLSPRGPDLLYDLVGELGLAPGAPVLDLGCGEGGPALRLADRFGFAVQGIDPVPRHIELARARAAAERPELAERVRFLLGTAEALPVADADVELIWCREVLYHIADLHQVFAECRRVLRPGGRMVIYNHFVTDSRALEGWWYASHGIVAASAEAATVEAALARQRFRTVQALDLGGEFGEYAAETAGAPGRRLLHTARLLRDPERYIRQFGRANYDLMLADCLWHVYRMIGTLRARVYVLARDKTVAPA